MNRKVIPRQRWIIYLVGSCSEASIDCFVLDQNVHITILSWKHRAVASGRAGRIIFFGQGIDLEVFFTSPLNST